MVRKLLENDPKTTSIRIELRREPSDAELARALEQNPFITKLEIVLAFFVGDVLRTEWPLLLGVIVARANLSTVELAAGADFLVVIAPAIPPTLMRSFLQAVQQNSSIRTMSLEESILIPDRDICAFLDAASSLKTFILRHCAFEPIEQYQGATNLGAALQRNGNIQSLELKALHDPYLPIIFRSLESNSTLRNLSLEASIHHFSGESSEAARHLLESTTSLQQLELIRFNWVRQSFQYLAQGIINSHTVTDLKFTACSFSDEASKTLFRSILVTKQNLRLLSMSCHFDRDISESLAALLLRRNSPLQCLELEELLEFPIQDCHFSLLLRAVEKSRLDRFQLKSYRSQEQIRSLSRSIPLMKVKKLDIELVECDWLQHCQVTEEDKEQLLHAVKKNLRLRSLQCTLRRRHYITQTEEKRDLFDQGERKRRLAFYIHRNECVGQFAEEPEKVDRKVWPDALGLAQQAGKDVLFTSLLSVLGSDYVNLFAGGRRKRKRPQQFEPS